MLVRQFGVEERRFVLRLDQWRDLEKARDCGLGEIAARLGPLVRLMSQGIEAYPGGLIGAITDGHLGGARVDDVRDCLLYGLIGGGVEDGFTSTEAGALVKKVFDEPIGKSGGPMLRWAPLALQIVTAAIIGLEDEPQVGEPIAAPAKKPKRRSRAEKPDLSPSMPL